MDSANLDGEKESKMNSFHYLWSPQSLVKNHSYFRYLQQLGVIILYYIVGVIFYHYKEGWNIVDCIYFITVSLTTVGYGDYAPSTDDSRIFTVFYVLLGLIFIFSIIAEFASGIINHVQESAVASLKELDKNQIHSSNHISVIAKAVVSVIMILACVFTGALFYEYNENWSFAKAFYVSFITTMTVGYGDVVFQNQSSRLFSIFYIICSVLIVATAIGNFGAIKVELVNDKKRLEMLSTKLDMTSLKQMSTKKIVINNKTQREVLGVDKIEFLTAMLVQMNGLNKDRDIEPWLKDIMMYENQGDMSESNTKSTMSPVYDNSYDLEMNDVYSSNTDNIS